MTAEKRQHTQILDHLARAERHGRLLVIVRCTRISIGGRQRFELHVQAGDEIAIVDVPGDQEAKLADHIDVLIEQFVAASRLRPDSAF